jgi:hypothetical protein
MSVSSRTTHVEEYQLKFEQYATTFGVLVRQEVGDRVHILDMDRTW